MRAAAATNVWRHLITTSSMHLMLLSSLAALINIELHSIYYARYVLIIVPSQASHQTDKFE